MNTQTSTSLDPREFRRALGNFATGVTIVTAATTDGQKVGVTANSFNSVSLDPPLVLWSIDKRSGSYPVFAQASHFAVNILAADQTDLSNQFARPKDDKFAGITHRTGAGGAPLFDGCAACFQCENYQQIDGGDHWIMIGKVIAFDDLGRAPLLYHQGTYAMVLPHARMQKKDENSPPPSAFQGRLSHNLYYLLTQAVRSYQANYQPKQLASGLRTSEARMLMVLESDAELDMAALLQEMAMPIREIEQAREILQDKAMVSHNGSGIRLTANGLKQAEMLWDIAASQQNSVLAGFSHEEIETCKKILRHIISLR